MADSTKKTTTQNTDTQPEFSQEELEQLSQRILELEEQLRTAKEGELRACADYNNLQRRSQEERTRIVQTATRSLVEDLLEPLEHLSLTATQLQNPILNMVIDKLWLVLHEHGLMELDVLNKPFNLETMEVVDLVDGATEETGKVVTVVKRGYALNGKVLQHAKVAIGKN